MLSRIAAQSAAIDRQSYRYIVAEDNKIDATIDLGAWGLLTSGIC